LATGVVKRVPNVKNYGFVLVGGEDGPEEIFFHRTSVADGKFDELLPGQQVKFEIARDPRDSTKRRAVEVTPVEG
jgi:cold shock CspA family protein